MIHLWYITTPRKWYFVPHLFYWDFLCMLYQVSILNYFLLPDGTPLYRYFSFYIHLTCWWLEYQVSYRRLMHWVGLNHWEVLRSQGLWPKQWMNLLIYYLMAFFGTWLKLLELGVSWKRQGCVFEGKSILSIPSWFLPLLANLREVISLLPRLSPPCCSSLSQETQWTTDWSCISSF